jgi:CBS domain-containing protein
MYLREMLHDRVLTIRPEDSIDKAIVLMEEHKIRHLPVVREDGAAVGMLSDRDIMEGVGWLLRRERMVVADGGGTIGPRRAGEIMSTPVVTLAPDDRLEAASRLMLEKNISAIALIEQQRVAGIVTVTDLLARYLHSRNEPRGQWRFARVSGHMRICVFTLEPHDLLPKAVHLMRRKRIRHVPILDQDRLIGMVSDHDIRRAVGRRAVGWAAEGPEWAAEVTMRDIMTFDVRTISPSSTLAEAADQLLQWRIGALPVLEDSRLVGIITGTDLLHVLTAACEA